MKKKFKTKKNKVKKLNRLIKSKIRQIRPKNGTPGKTSNNFSKCSSSKIRHIYNRKKPGIHIQRTVKMIP
jgi:hypothetical protein